ncbi:MAG: site-specific integrase [Acidimicrobiales bacterium]|jgi:integrase|nr:site-specific integrase [Acidimicrobiales bacterium]
MKGTARKRGTDRWQIQVYAGVDPGTGRERRVTRTIVAPHTKAGQKAVDQALATLILDVEHGRIGAGDDPTVTELLDRWVRAREPEWSPKTTLENRRQIRLKIVPNIGNRRVSKVRAADLDLLYAQLRNGGGETGGPLSPASVRRIHVIMHAALGQAVKWGLIANNPADAATAPSLPPSRITPPEPDALARAMRLVDEGDIDYATYLRLAATTGARRSQLVALHWSDIDLEVGTVTFCRAIIDGGPDVGLVERGTKTGRKWKVALAPATAERVRAFQSVCEERAAAVGVKLDRDGYVFAAEPDGSASWRPDNVSARWRRIRKAADLDGVRLHDLRHYVATQLLGAGVDPRTVAGRLGHANPAVTMTVYGHFLPEKDRAAADFLDDLLDG